MKLVVEEGNIRIDKYLVEKTDYSRSKIQKLIKDGNILVNNKKISANYNIKLNDEIIINDNEEKIIENTPEKMDLDIVYEDEYLAIINKKSGLVVHPAIGNYNHTLVNGLLYHFNNISNKETIRPGIVHRLDKDTSGLMIVAKDDKTHEKLSNMIRKKKIERKYLALVWGVLKHDKGTIDAPIGRDINDRQKYTVTDINSKDSITHFKVVKRYKEVTLIECILETGRTHQIRCHMEYIGHPIVNDPVYGNHSLIDNSGQALHSFELTLIHPRTKEKMTFKAETPECFNKILKIMEEE